MLPPPLTPDRTVPSFGFSPRTRCLGLGGGPCRLCGPWGPRAEWVVHRPTLRGAAAQRLFPLSTQLAEKGTQGGISGLWCVHVLRVHVCAHHVHTCASCVHVWVWPCECGVSLHMHMCAHIFSSATWHVAGVRKARGCWWPRVRGLPSFGGPMQSGCSQNVRPNSTEAAPGLLVGRPTP